TEVLNAVSAVVTADVSDNGTDWVTASFRDFQASATISTVTLSSDGEYFMYMDWSIPKPYMRINISGQNVDSDDIAVVDVELVGSR
ncbi:unnamed protein product, partial [marine sediment metagenome]